MKKSIALVFIVGTLLLVSCSTTNHVTRTEQYKQCIARAKSHEHAHDYNAAIADCTEAIRLDPKSAPAYDIRGSAYMDKADKDKGYFDKAIADYSEAIRLKPNVISYYSERSEAYGLKGEYAKAIADCDNWIRLDPKNANAYETRGGAKYLTGDYDGAISDATQVIQLDPKDGDAYSIRAWAHLGKGDTAGAMRDCKKAVELSKPDDPVGANLNQGLLDFINSDYKNAAAHWEEVIQKEASSKRFLQPWIEKAKGLEGKQ